MASPDSAWVSRLTDQLPAFIRVAGPYGWVLSVDATGTGIAFRSADGRDWSNVLIHRGSNIVDLAMGPTGYVAIGSLTAGCDTGASPCGRPLIARSPDGNTWEAVGFSSPQPVELRRVFFFDGRFVVFGMVCPMSPGLVTLAAAGVAANAAPCVQHPAIWISSDGLAWQAGAALPDAAGSGLGDAASDGDALIATWGSGLWRSTDAVRWSRVVIPGASFTLAITGAEHRFAALGASTQATTVFDSLDGVAWTSHSVPLVTDNGGPENLVITPTGIVLTGEIDVTVSSATPALWALSDRGWQVISGPPPDITTFSPAAVVGDWLVIGSAGIWCHPLPIP